jgi:O-antigen/teichoic acid export membrane protein
MIKGVIKASAIFTLGNMLPLLTSVVLLFPYTDNLSTSLYGELALYIAFTIFVQFTANYGLDNFVGINHFQYKDNPVSMKAFVGSVVGTLLIIGAVITIFFLVSGNFIFQVLFKGQLHFFPFGFLSVLTGVFNAFFRSYINFLFYRDEPKKHLLFNLFNFFVTIVICTLGLYKYPETLIGPIWGRFLSGFLIFILALIYFQREYGIRLIRSYMSGFHRFCLPVYLFVLLGWVVFYINNFIINYYSTTADVGVYDFALKVVVLIEVVQIAISATINPRIYQMWTDTGLTRSTLGENRFHNVFTMFSILFIAICIIALPLAVQVFVRNEEYYAVFQYIPVLCVAFSFRVLTNVFYNPLMYFKKTGALPRSLGWSSIVQIVTCIILLPAFGLWGAVWSYFISKIAIVFFNWWESRKIFQYQFNLYKMLFLPIAYTALVIILHFTIGMKNYYLMATIQACAALVLILLVFRKDLLAYKLIFQKPE